MENKTTRLYTRIIPAEEKRIFSLAKRCGLSVSEYIRQQPPGSAPRKIQPGIFYELVRRIKPLYQESSNEMLHSLMRDTHRTHPGLERQGDETMITTGLWPIKGQLNKV